MTRKRFSACWGNSPIPIERCLRHRAAHPFRMLQRQFLPKKKSPVQHEHYTHTAPDFPSSTTLSIFFFLPHFLLMQLLFFLLVLFQDFLHDFLCHKPILHFRFGLAVLCIGAFLSFQKHRILCVQLADARELFVRTVLFLIGIKSRAAQKSRRYTPCGMISCFIRLFSLAILVPCVLLACFLRSKTDHFRGPRTAPKALNFLQIDVVRRTEK